MGNGKAPPTSPERTALLEQLRTLSASSRRSVGGTAYSSISKALSLTLTLALTLSLTLTPTPTATLTLPPTLTLSQELSDAKKAYCQLSSNTGSTYCKPPSIKSLSGAVPRLSGR